MAELPEKSPGEIIDSAHINDIAARSIQRYADAANRDLLNPTPVQGQLAYVIDSGQVQVFNGSGWVMGAGGDVTGNIDMKGNQVLGLGDPSGASNAINLGFADARYVPVAEGPWVALPLVNGWEQIADGTSSDAVYRIDGSGYVWVQGLVKNGTLTGDVGVLPAGFRPANNIYFATNSNHAPAGLVVTSGGAIAISFGASATWLSLALSFHADL